MAEAHNRDAPSLDGLTSAAGRRTALAGFLEAVRCRTWDARQLHAALGDLTRTEELRAIFDDTTEVVSMYLQSRQQRFDTTREGEIAESYELALDLHGIVRGDSVMWSRRWNLRLRLVGSDLAAAHDLSASLRNVGLSVPVRVASAVRVSSALVGVLEARLGSMAGEPLSFVDDLQMTALGFLSSQFPSFENVSDFDVLDQIVKAHHFLTRRDHVSPSAPVRH